MAAEKSIMTVNDVRNMLKFPGRPVPIVEPVTSTQEAIATVKPLVVPTPAPVTTEEIQKTTKGRKLDRKQAE